MQETIENSYSAFGHPIICRSIVYDKYSRLKEFVVERRPPYYRRWFGTCVGLFGLTYSLRIYDVMTPICQYTVLLFMVAVILSCLHFKVQKESLLVISSLGVQLQTTFVSGRQDLLFIGNDQIKGVIINEGITMHSVLFYLAIVLQSQESQILPLFQYTMPRLDFIQRIYKILEASPKKKF